MKNFLEFSTLLFVVMVIFSCERDKINEFHPTNDVDTLSNYRTKYFLYNLPIKDDTIFIDKDYGIDFRVEFEGYIVDTVIISIDNWKTITYDTNIISTNFFKYREGEHKISFSILMVNIEKNTKIHFKSDTFSLKSLPDISNRFINNSVYDGRLKITWPQFDKKNTSYYLVERCLGENKQFIQEFQVTDSVFIDEYYVGEEVYYIISVINNEGRKQNIWNYYKKREDPTFSVAQDKDGSYSINYSSCKYYNNFGKYIITSGLNSNPEILNTTSSITDTLYKPFDALFGDEGRFWLRCFPKELPKGVTEEDWVIYGHFIYVRYGEKSFRFDRIAVVNENYIVFTRDGNIFKYDLASDVVVDSIDHKYATYGFLRTTTGGKYLYAVDENIYDSPLYIWSTDTFTKSPKYTFDINFIIPSVSDNLISIMSTPSSTTDSDIALYDVVSGSNFYTTPYKAYSTHPCISSNGQYLFIYDSGLKLCSYKNGIFKVIWEESNWLKFYNWYSFNPDNSDCYLWDDQKNFSICNISDFTNINTFKIDVENIINIDYYAGKIMGYKNTKIVIYNLNSGILEKEVPASIGNLFLYGYSTILIGNEIYCHHGLKYELGD